MNSFGIKSSLYTINLRRLNYNDLTDLFYVLHLGSCRFFFLFFFKFFYNDPYLPRHIQAMKTYPETCKIHSECQ